MTEAPSVPRKGSQRRVRAAWIAAIAADALQLVLVPLVLGGALSPVNDWIDLAAAAVLISLAGWHWAFLPSFIIKLVPVVDLAPTWTIAMWVATRRSKAALPAPEETAR